MTIVKNCMIDWLEFTVKKINLLQVMSIMDLNELSYENSKAKWYGISMVYDSCIYFQADYRGNVDKETKNHVHVIITGNGCRFLENKYEVKDLREEITARFDGIQIKVSRMDICVDYDKKFVRNFFDEVLYKNFKGVRSREFAGSDGLTWYLGSRKSEKFFRAYEKDIESGDFKKYKDRLELVLRDHYATNELYNNNNIYKIISTYMNDIKWLKPEIQEAWDNMKGETCIISPKIKHKKTTLKEKAEYVINTHGNTLRAYCEQYGTLEITRGIHESVYSQKDLRLIQNAKVLSMMKYRKKASAIKAEQYIAANE